MIDGQAHPPIQQSVPERKSQPEPPAADGNLALQPIGLGQADFTKFFEEYS